MHQFIEKYRRSISIALGVLITVIVVLVWLNNQSSIRKNQSEKIEETTKLLTIQFQRAIQDNIKILQNLSDRIEVTNGSYFDYWEFDASQIVSQDSSFLFIEWIDSSMVIRRVTPLQGNEEAIGLDISELDYRREQWLQTKKDSLINFTYWLQLVQGPNAFLMDVPVFYDDRFQGTLTAGLDLTKRFDHIMQGLEQYHIHINDARGETFYQFGEHSDAGYFDELIVERSIELKNTNSADWMVRVFPNQIFKNESLVWESYVNLFLALILGLLVSVIFYFMQTAYLAERNESQANEKLRALIESAPVAIYAIDTDGVIHDIWNKAAEKMLGWKQEEVMGRMMPHVEGKWEDDFKNLMDKTLEQGTIRNQEIIRSHKDGTPIHLRLNVGRIVKDRSNKPLMLAILEDITKEKEYQEQLENSVKEKEVLLSEIHHRVKNNLAIIAGLIELQKEGITDEDLQNILKETQNRIYSISGVHELLYNTESFTEITFEEYAKKLIGRIQRMFHSQSKSIDIDYDFGSCHLNINQAIPLGLLLNELVTNSFKHAFVDHDDGHIKIKLKQKGEEITVQYQDNGNGFNQELFERSKSLGVTLIKTLLDQLSADYTINTKNGFDFTFTFQLSSANGTRGAHSNLS